MSGKLKIAIPAMVLALNWISAQANTETHVAAERTVNGDGGAGNRSGSDTGNVLPRYDHVVVVIEENHSKSHIIDNSAAPFINSLANSGVLFSQSYAIEHPSQPNYLDLFSGANQGVRDDDCPVGPFEAPNLATQLNDAGYQFTAYSENLPLKGSTVCSSHGYVRKHSPWVNFTNVPSRMNKPLVAFPSNYNSLPEIAWVIPTLDYDMHDGSVAQGDSWLKNKLGDYARWAQQHNSLLIVTWDEDAYWHNNKIPTIFYGAHLKSGTYSERINHYSILRLLEDIYGLPHAGHTDSATAIRDVFSN